MTEREYTELVLSIPKSEGKKIMRWKWRDDKEWKMFERLMDDGHSYKVAMQTVEEAIDRLNGLRDLSKDRFVCILSSLGILSLNEITEKYLIEFLEYVEKSGATNITDKLAFVKGYLSFKKEAKS